MKDQNGPLIDLSPIEGNDQKRRPASDIFNPDDYESIRLRRIFAYAIDVLCIAVISVAAAFAATLIGVITLGVLTPLLVLILAAIPLIYHTLLVGGPGNATIGMRFMNIRMERMDGGAPDYLVALIHAAIFYFTLAATSSLILLVSLFNPRGRLLQDYLVNTVIRRIPLHS
ncbi:RDD family protein [Sneathiella litorea]|uniref:RDD family protein n=1 Tax=Sneathiella litorea TaxID=2606216 RepID=A0A6L8W9F3_9PROT|nr:RDD family protein [Sneathiella litorea]MZR31072.1 RDD family protein [Sneathiella litorea]